MEKNELSMAELTNVKAGNNRIPEVNKRIQELTQKIQELNKIENNNPDLINDQEFQSLKKSAQSELAKLDKERMTYNIENVSNGMYSSGNLNSDVKPEDKPQTTYMHY